MPTPGKQEPYGLDQGAGGEHRVGGRQSNLGSRFDVLEQRGVYIITLLDAEILDAHEIDQLGDDLQKFVGGKQSAKVVLDMQGVRFLSSAALSMLLIVRSTIDSNGGALRLANVNENIQEVFKITKLDKVITIKENTSAAIASL